MSKTERLALHELGEPRASKLSMVTTLPPDIGAQHGLGRPL